MPAFVMQLFRPIAGGKGNVGETHDWMIRLVSKLSDEQIQDMLRSNMEAERNICRCGRYHRRQTLLETGSSIFSSHRVAAFVETGG